MLSRLVLCEGRWDFSSLGSANNAGVGPSRPAMFFSSDLRQRPSSAQLRLRFSERNHAKSWPCELPAGTRAF